MSRRNRKLRRRIRMTLKSGHEARHKLVAGRTGSVHHKKTRIFAKADGVVKVLVDYRKSTPAVVTLENPSVFFQPKVRKRPKPQLIEIFEAPITIIEEGHDTSIDLSQQCYSLCLRALHILSGLNPQPNSPEGRLFESISQGIEGYEKFKSKKEK